MIIKRPFTKHDDTLPVPLAEMLISKMTHDLASPLGAVRNGVEFLKDESAGMGAEALDLLEQSAHVSSARLRFFRLAYGNDMGSHNLTAHQISAVINSYFKYENRLKIEIENCQDGVPAPLIKLLFNALLCGMGCLPKGGTIYINEATSTDIALTVAGDEVRGDFVLDGETNEITPHTVQPIYMQFLLGRYRYEYRLETLPKSLNFTVHYKK